MLVEIVDLILGDYGDGKEGDYPHERDKEDLQIG